MECSWMTDYGSVQNAYDVYNVYRYLYEHTDMDNYSFKVKQICMEPQQKKVIFEMKTDDTTVLLDFSFYSKSFFS